MISGQVAARPDIPGRRASSSFRVLSRGQILRRRLRRASWCALSLYLSFTITSPAGEKDPARPINLFVDITSTRLADEVQEDSKRRFDFAGVPVVVGTARQSGDAAPSVAAGIIGGYNFDLGDHMTAQATGLVSRVHTDGAGILATGRAGGDIAFQYQNGGTRLLLRPSLYAAMQDDVLDHVDYALESKLWQAIGWGLDLTASLGHAWHADDQLVTEDRETGYGRLGLHMSLFDSSDLELTYGFSTTEGPLASQFNVTHGPTLQAHVALADGWTIDGSYSLSATERGYDDSDEGARRHDLRQHLGLQSDWDLSSSTGADWHVQAMYDYQVVLTDDPVCVPASHTAMVSFALDF
jgi:hypothetical protein